MADSIYWTMIEKFSYAPYCAYSPEGEYARSLLKLNTNSNRLYGSANDLTETQRSRIKAGRGPYSNNPIQNVTHLVSELCIIQVAHDKARKKAANDALIGTQIQIPQSIGRDGNPTPSRWARFLEIGAILASFVAEIWIFMEQNPPEVVNRNTALQQKMIGLGYVLTSHVPNGWICPDGKGFPMRDFTGGHQKMLYDMGIYPQGGYTDFEYAYLIYNLIRKANYLTYSLIGIQDSNRINALKYQITHDYDAGRIKSADRMLIEDLLTSPPRVFTPTVQELITDGFHQTLSRPMRDSGVYQ